jgi:hypothetical protein
LGSARDETNFAQQALGGGGMCVCRHALKCNKPQVRGVITSVTLALLRHQALICAACVASMSLAIFLPSSTPHWS